MSFHGLNVRQPVVIGRKPKSRLGALLNTVETPASPCPECATTGPMDVYVLAVRWPCGHTRSLPPLKTTYRSSELVAYLRDIKEVA